MTTNDKIQWVGAAFIIAMYILNAIGPSVYPYNVICALGGTAAFLTWSWRVGNIAQLMVNIVSMVICIAGLFKYVFF